MAYKQSPAKFFGAISAIGRRKKKTTTKAAPKRKKTAVASLASPYKRVKGAKYKKPPVGRRSSTIKPKTGLISGVAGMVKGKRKAAASKRRKRGGLRGVIRGAATALSKRIKRGAKTTRRVVRGAKRAASKVGGRGKAALGGLLRMAGKKRTARKRVVRGVKRGVASIGRIAGKRVKNGAKRVRRAAGGARRMMRRFTRRRRR